MSKKNATKPLPTTEKNKGLTEEQAKEALAKFGPNVIVQKSKNPWYSILLRQVKGNFIFYLLTFAALISFLVGKSVTGYVIVSVIVLVVSVGFFLEFKAEKALEALKKLVDDKTEVMRDGKKQLVSASLLVPDDIIFLKTGDKIPADCILLEANDLSLNESALTGESVEVEKTAPLGTEYSEKHQIFMGTFVVRGNCVAVVSKTGMDTRFGSIAGMISEAEKTIPLQNKINHISKYMITVSLVFSFLTGTLLFMRASSFEAEVVIGIITVVIALSVSAVPEGLPVVLVTTLASGAMRMAKKNAVVNRMGVIGTIGETTVICSDKTGTITAGEMTVKKIALPQTLLDVSGSGYKNEGKVEWKNASDQKKYKSDLMALVKAGLICNDSSFSSGGSGIMTMGSPTELSLIALGSKCGVEKEDLKTERVSEKPFSSSRKMMSVQTKDKMVYAKGALEVLLPLCSKVLVEGKERPFTAQEKDSILEQNKQLNDQAYRTLAIVCKTSEKAGSYKETDFVFLGLVGIEDPPRAGVREAIEVCKKAHVKVIMITGDNKDTASAIARQIGLTGEVLEGRELDKISDKELKQTVQDVAIFARVRPEHKVRIVKALKANGELVAMTGDGVNDAPALKESHVGIAMGINGTDVSRSVADITLKDDNFVTIVEAIKQGRGIFENIQTFVGYQLSCNLSQLTILFIGVLVGPIFGWQIPLLVALQILLVNLVTDNIPAITLGLIPASDSVLNRKPTRSGLMTKQLVVFILSIGILTALVTLCAYYYAHDIMGSSHEQARSVAFVTFIVAAILNAISFRSLNQSIVFAFTKENALLFLASGVSLFATLLVVYTPINTIFETKPLTLQEWGYVGIGALTVTVLFELVKLISKATQTIGRKNLTSI